MNDHQTFLILSLALGIYATLVPTNNVDHPLVVHVVETIKALVATVVSTIQRLRRRTATPDVEQANGVELAIVHTPEHHTTPSSNPIPVPINSPQSMIPPATSHLRASAPVRDFAVPNIAQDL